MNRRFEDFVRTITDEGVTVALVRFLKMQLLMKQKLQVDAGAGVWFMLNGYVGPTPTWAGHGSSAMYELPHTMLSFYLYVSPRDPKVCDIFDEAKGHEHMFSHDYEPAGDWNIWLYAGEFPAVGKWHWADSNQQAT